MRVQIEGLGNGSSWETCICKSKHSIANCVCLLFHLFFSFFHLLLHRRVLSLKNLIFCTILFCLKIPILKFGIDFILNLEFA